MFLGWVVLPIATAVFRYCLVWLIGAIGIVIMVCLAAVGLGLLVALGGVALGLIPVAASLLAFGAVIHFSVRVCQHYWTAYGYPYFFAEHIRQAKAAEVRERAEHEADIVRRQREAEARADRVFADLEKGVRFGEPLPDARKLKQETTEDGGEVKISFSPDYLMPQRRVLEIYCLPLLRTDYAILGLVIRTAEGKDDHYERLGTFTSSLHELMKLPCSPDKGFLLV